MVAVLLSLSETMKVAVNIQILQRHRRNFFPAVIISPPSPNGVYTVEVQRTFIVTCSGSNFEDIVAWIRKY